MQCNRVKFILAQYSREATQPTTPCSQRKNHTDVLMGEDKHMVKHRAHSRRKVAKETPATNAMPQALQAGNEAPPSTQRCLGQRPGEQGQEETRTEEGAPLSYFHDCPVPGSYRLLWRGGGLGKVVDGRWTAKPTASAYCWQTIQNWILKGTVCKGSPQRWNTLV